MENYSITISHLNFLVDTRCSDTIGTIDNEFNRVVKELKRNQELNSWELLLGEESIFKLKGSKYKEDWNYRFFKFSEWKLVPPGNYLK